MKSLTVAAFALLAAASPGTNSGWSHPADSQSVAFSPNGTLVASGGAGTHIWSAASGTLVRTLQAHHDDSQAVAFSHDGAFVAGGSGSFNQNLNIWRSDGALITERVTAHSNGVEGVQFSPTSPILATSGRDAETKLWTVPELTLIRSIPSGKRTFSVRFFPDGSRLATGGQHGVSIWDVASGALVRTLDGSLTDIQSISVSPDGQLVAAGYDVIDAEGQSVDSSIRIWRASDGVLVKQLQRAGTYGTYAVAFSPDSKYIAAGGDSRVQDKYEGYFRIWRVSDGSVVKNLSIPDPQGIGMTAVTSIDYTHDGTKIAYTRLDTALTVIPNPF